jgi:cardiolipin synthase
MNQLRAAPNQLTLVRLCIIPFIVLAVLDHRYRVAFALFVLAGITDGMDGLLARWLRQHTTLGQYLDPLSQFFAPAWVLYIRHLALLATVAFTVISGFHYAWQITRRLSLSGAANG